MYLNLMQIYSKIWRLKLFNFLIFVNPKQIYNKIMIPIRNAISRDLAKKKNLGCMVNSLTVVICKKYISEIN